MPQFDAMVTYSSLEHSGLGRYGDSLNPWGDLITMAQAWCLLKPGARALVGLPSEFSKAEYRLIPKILKWDKYLKFASDNIFYRNQNSKIKISHREKIQSKHKSQCNQ